jgi:hypothetical protein
MTAFKTGSMLNHLMSQTAKAPVVGEGGTFLLWTDRTAFEVLSVSESGKRVEIQRFNKKRLDSNGMTDSGQVYSYEKENLNGHTETLVFRHNAWRKEIKGVEFVRAYYAQFEQMAIEEGRQTARAKMLAPLYENKEFGLLALVEGKTREVVSYEKITLIFGVRETYHDYSF